MLAEGTNRTFLLANHEFEFLIDSFELWNVALSKKLKMQRCHLRQIGKNIFHFGR